METVHSFMMDLYFESAGMILTLITLGKTLEHVQREKHQTQITKLMNLAPKTAVVERKWTGDYDSGRGSTSWRNADCESWRSSAKWMA